MSEARTGKGWQAAGWIWIAAIGLALAWKAVLQAFTWDEAYTFSEYVLREWSHAPDANYNLGNHHLLNTWLMRLCSMPFGDAEWSLRLPNLLAGFGFLLLARQMAYRWASGGGAFVWLVVCTANPYLLDFFTVARGYGLASTGILLALVASVGFLQTGKSNRLWLAQFALVWAGLANLTTLYALLAVNALLFLHLLLPAGAAQRRLGVWAAFAVPLVFLCWAVPYGLYLNETGSLYFGGSKGFWRDTLWSLFNNSSYLVPATWYAYPALIWARWLLVGSGVALGFAGLLRFARKREWFAQPFNWFPMAVLALALLGSRLHVALGANTLTDRTALFLLPMAQCALGLGMKAWRSRFLVGAVGLLAPVFLGVTWNARKMAEWPDDACAKVAFQRNLGRLREGDQTLGIGFHLEPSLNYYRLRNGLSTLSPIHREDEPNPWHNHFVVKKGTALPAWAHLVDSFPEEEMVWAEALPYRDRLVWQAGTSFLPTDTLGLGQELKETLSGGRFPWVGQGKEFGGTLEVPLPACPPPALGTVVLDVEAWVLRAPGGSDARLVISLDSSGTNLHYEGWALNQFTGKAGTWQRIFVRVFAHKGLFSSSRFKAYLWQTGTGLAWIRSCRVKALVRTPGNLKYEQLNRYNHGKTKEKQQGPNP